MRARPWQINWSGPSAVNRVEHARPDRAAGGGANVSKIARRGCDRHVPARRDSEMSAAAESPATSSAATEAATARLRGTHVRLLVVHEVGGHDQSVLEVVDAERRGPREKRHRAEVAGDHVLRADAPRRSPAAISARVMCMYILNDGRPRGRPNTGPCRWRSSADVRKWTWYSGKPGGLRGTGPVTSHRRPRHGPRVDHVA